MQNKRKKINKKEITKIREDKNIPYEKGDFCFYLDAYDKVGFATICNVKMINGEVIYTILDQTSQRYSIIQHMFCNDEESFLKKKKRKDIMEENKK